MYQKFFGKMVKIKEMSFLSTRGMILMFGNCMKGTANGSKVFIVLLDSCLHLKSCIFYDNQ